MNPATPESGLKQVPGVRRPGDQLVVIHSGRHQGLDGHGGLGFKHDGNQASCDLQNQEHGEHEATGVKQANVVEVQSKFPAENSHREGCADDHSGQASVDVDLVGEAVVHHEPGVQDHSKPEQNSVQEPTQHEDVEVVNKDDES